MTTIADIVETTAVAEKSVNNEEAINGKDDQLQDKRTSDEPTTAPVREERPEELAAEAKEESKITDRAEPCEIHREIAQTQSIKQPDQVVTAVTGSPDSANQHSSADSHQPIKTIVDNEDTSAEKQPEEKAYEARKVNILSNTEQPADVEKPEKPEKPDQVISNVLESEKEEVEVYCVCRGSYEHSFMINCNQCLEW